MAFDAVRTAASCKKRRYGTFVYLPRFLRLLHLGVTSLWRIMEQAKTMKPIRFAVVGCGHIGKRHAEMICREDGAELVALCDIRPKSELAIDAYANVPFFSTLDDLLASDLSFDVVNICTPNGLHAHMAIQSIETGYHVVIEKPMALTTADAEKVVYAGLKYRKQIFCVMQNRYSPPSVWIKDLIESGQLGRVYMVQLNCYWNRDARYYRPGGWHGTADLDGGTLFTQFSHFIDILYWLFGDITIYKRVSPTSTTSTSPTLKIQALSVFGSQMEASVRSTIRRRYGIRTKKAA